LVNIRLDEERLRRVQKLRENGLALSDVVREAIDERFESMNRPVNPRDVKGIIARIFQEHPDPADLPARTSNVHDRRAARAAILRKLKRRRR